MSIFKSKLNKIESGRDGFTMVETLVAISILTIAVIGPLGIISQALHTSYYTRNQMTAYYLAQEAIEYVKNERDEQGIVMTKQYLDSNSSDQNTPITTSWIPSDIASSTFNPVNLLQSTRPNAYILSIDNTTGKYKLDLCNTNCEQAEILKVSQNGIFGVDSSAPNSTDSIFRREIYFQRTPGTTGAVGDPQEFAMIVNVYWKEGSSQAKLTLKEYITNSAVKNG